MFRAIFVGSVRTIEYVVSIHLTVKIYSFHRYNQRYVDQAAVAAQLAQAKYGSGASQYGAGSTLRRNRGSLDYSSDTEATSGSRSGYYYYR